MRAIAIVITVLVSLAPVSSFAADNHTTWADPHALSMPRTLPVIDAELQRYMQSAPSDQVISALVFFTDKGIADNAEFTQAMASAEANLTEAARARRMKSRGPENLVDFRDLPVYGPYIDNVLADGANLRFALKWFNAVSIEATPAQLEAIASQQNVRFIKKVASWDTDFELRVDPIPPEMPLSSLNYGPSQNQLNQINVIPAHELGFKGQGVLVCMMDTGYRQNHEAFQNIINSGRLIAQYDFINHDNNTEYDPNQESEGQPSHGTVTWSTLGGESSSHLYGPSYMASFILCKTEDVSSERHIEEDNWAAAAEWADSIGAQVISASLGYRDFDPDQTDYTYSDLDGNTTIVTNAADLAVYNGIAVATAMGNEGNTPGSIVAPADGDSVIGCGAVDPNGVMAWFSGWGPTSDGRTKPEVCAQGEGTVCVEPGTVSGYGTSSGTSLSTPLVGGACAVLLSAHPNWSSVMVREALMMTADRADSADNEFGYGIADVIRALYYHPQGDIVFDFRPPVVADLNRPINLGINITGGAGIASANLFWRNGSTGTFTQISMTGNGPGYAAQIPTQSGSTVQYYFKATDSNGVFAYNPLGDSVHPYSIGLGATSFVDSLDHGRHYWGTGGVNDYWGLSAKYARSGDLSITESTSGNYRNNTDSYLRSRFAINLAGSTAANISFWWRGLMESNRDTLFVEISTDGGTNWNRLPQSISASGLAFAQYNASLDPYIGNPDVRVQLHFKSNATTNREGLYIDDITISGVMTAIGDDPVALPNAVALMQNYPNPFNPSTMISFSMPVAGRAELAIFDLLGRKVRTLVNGEIAVGNHDVIWDGRDSRGMNVASGVYVYRLRTSDSNLSRRMTLVR
jgi:hypothetical protein